MGMGTLANLIATDPERVIHAWGMACKKAFFDDLKPPLTAMWRKPTRVKQPKKLNDTTTLIPVDAACAAIHPDGTYWRAVASPANDIFMERSLI
jgi:hypothetical protein